MEARKDIARPSIEYSSLPQVDVKETQGGAKGEFSEDSAESSLSFDRIVLQRRIIILGRAFDYGFPIGVAVVFFHKAIDSGKGMVIHNRIQFTCTSLNDHMLVDFVISTIGRKIGDFFISSHFVSK